MMKSNSNKRSTTFCGCTQMATPHWMIWKRCLVPSLLCCALIQSTAWSTCVAIHAHAAVLVSAKPVPNPNPKPNPSDKCDNCNGTGRSGDGLSECPVCDGTGRKKTTTPLAPPPKSKRRLLRIKYSDGTYSPTFYEGDPRPERVQQDCPT